jgi:hypothetical protein
MACRVGELALVTRLVSVSLPIRLQNSSHWLLPSVLLLGARNLMKQGRAASVSHLFGVCYLRPCPAVMQNPQKVFSVHLLLLRVKFPFSVCVLERVL